MSGVTEGFGNEKLPTVIKAPFSKKSIKSIMVRGSESFFEDGKWNFVGQVKFKEGNTSGEQEFNGTDFDHVVLQIKAMLENLD